MKEVYLWSRRLERSMIPVVICIFFMVFSIEGYGLAFTFYNSKKNVKEKADAKEVEKHIVGQMKSEKAKEKALIDHFYGEGKRLLEEGDYESAIDYLSRVLEIDSSHKGAKDGIKKVRMRLDEAKRTASPGEMAKRLMRSGRLKYSMKDYDGAIEDFQDALVLDYSNKDILEWLKRARRRQSMDEIGGEEEDLIKDTEVATKKKGAREKAAMLEVESAYLPPTKPERKQLEAKDLIVPEEDKKEKARRDLLEKLQEKMVPAISLTEADIRDVIRQLMEITGVTIVIDEGALARAVEEEPLRITVNTVNPVPLLEVLDIALRPTGLDYGVEPNYIWISTPEKLKQEELVTRTYRLRYGVRKIRKVELKEFVTKSSTED